MVLRVERTALQTMTAATDSVTTGKIHGRILSVKINTSASNSFSIYTSGSVITEYLLGSAAVTVASDTAFYPRIIGHLASDGSDLSAADNLYQHMVIDSAVKIDVASGASDDTWSVEIFYED